MLDGGAKKILKLDLPTVRGTKTNTKRGNFTPRTMLQLKALKRHAVVKGACLNPYGSLGDTPRMKWRIWNRNLKIKPAFREASMKRRRLQLKEKKKVALEAHELQQIARENATLAMRTLVNISKNPRAPEATRIAASSVILDRAYGKASQTTISASVTSGKANEIGPEELDQRIKRALKRVEDITSRTPKAPVSKKRSADLRKLN